MDPIGDGWNEEDKKWLKWLVIAKQKGREKAQKQEANGAQKHNSTSMLNSAI